MNFLPDVPYPKSEKEKLELLKSLFSDWHGHFARAGSILGKYVANDMVFDGFYPYYFSQKKRILFIGRESREISGENYIDMLYPVYRGTKSFDGQHLNASKFHSRMFYIAYGIMNGMPAFQEIPYASEIGETFGTANGLSFAFMNISKLSNQGAAWQSDWGVINAAYSLSTQGRNFVQEQVAILEPDVIITMNLMDYLPDELDSLGKWDRIDSTHPGVTVWRLDIGDHRSLVIDTWHFASRKKQDDADYYIPTCDAIRRGESSS